MTRTTDIMGWGRYPRKPGQMVRPRTETEIRAHVAQNGIIARGNGRAYGDSAIGSASTLDMRAMNRMISFDDTHGQLVAEAGVLLGDVIDAFLPRGWFPFVTPGTKFVSLGGAIAADVHGKNHHCDGSFGAFVNWIDVMDAAGHVTRASRFENTDLFAWTIGGMGLTGVILRAAIRLRPVETAWIQQNSLVAPNLTAAIQTIENTQAATYSVAWIDCLAKGKNLGRSIIMLGEHATLSDLPAERRDHPFSTPQRKKKTFPFDAPTACLNKATVKLFNALYWRKGKQSTGTSLVDWDSYFYPLDAILKWNRLYGRAGFVQFQCVLPLDQSEAGLTAILTETAAAGQGSFLAVLKRFGVQDSKLSFPTEGYTLALDFPANAKTLALLDRLDAITLDHGGRFYLAKDARLAAATLHKSDPRMSDLRQMRLKSGLDRQFSSAQSERLLL
ncbi:FAD/FMN-containing dehydrogenase [Loktanella ponticola]|uniref:FAD/FMN-containing dehydrogenase n=1 Tax=Yoonia ponticola TaxID=1524255 RepID=A0A7W9EYV4_9RHOB|nr:FAD-binding oxidoreductase [Yoonia ponticola]MBB5721256.1 FAD/FMN-containing dehydrogenase [Yoonia ponticola]